MTNDPPDLARLKETLDNHGQGQVLRFWDRLSHEERLALAGQIEQLDLAELRGLFEKSGGDVDWAALARDAEPADAITLGGGASGAAGDRGFSTDAVRGAGREMIASGGVAVVLVAGGQGTRLGFSYPKGMYPIGPVSGHTLFQILCEKILAVSRKYSRPLPLVVMTSPATHDATLDYFTRHARHGLPEGDVTLVCQGTMPAVDATTGELLLEAPGRLALSPDGHGGLVRAIERAGTLDALAKRGVRWLFYMQVDNPLVRVCDEEFLGHHQLHRSVMSTLVVRKLDPAERVGLVVKVAGKTRIIEYSDLPPDAAARRAPDGSLALWAGNTATHVIDLSLIQRAAAQDALPFHRARKKVPCLDAAGRMVEPDCPNAFKFERFIFDLLPLAERALVVEVNPSEAFAPVKNAPGEASDTPATAQSAMIALHRRWLRQAGYEVDDDVPVEISPLTANGPDELDDNVQPGERIETPRFIR